METKDQTYDSIFDSKKQFVEGVVASVKRIKFKLYLILVTQALLPTIYSSVRVSLLGDLPSDEGVNIASQVRIMAFRLI